MAEYELDDFDFGFTTHSDDEFVDAEEAHHAQDKARAMYNGRI